MTDNPQWTPETGQGTARAICAAAHDIFEAWEDYAEEAEGALKFLAGEGLLLPPGGEVYTEYGFVHRNSRGGSYSSHNQDDAHDAYLRAGGNDKVRWGTRIGIEWPETGGQYYGPWQFDGE